MELVLSFDIERRKTIRNAVPEMADIFEKHDAKATWFLTQDHSQDTVHNFPAIVERMASVGEIGTHVHFSDESGTYTMDADVQRELLETATETVRGQGYDAVAFRAGSYRLDANTVEILDDLDYRIDSSVVPGARISVPDGVVVDHSHRHGRGANRPYRLAANARSDGGKSTIFEVPVTVPLPYASRGVPSIPFSGPFGRAIGWPAGGKLARLVVEYWRAVGDSPLVLVAHDFNFDGERCLEQFERFVSFCASRRDVEFVTMSQLYDRYAESRSPRPSDGLRH